MPKTFLARRLTFVFTLVPNATSPAAFSGGGKTLTISNVRASTKTAKGGGKTNNNMDAAIYGMTLSQMNTLSTLGLLYKLIPPNMVALYAGDASSDRLNLVFQGNITDAFADLNASPNVPFRVIGSEGAFPAVQAIPATSYKGPVDVALAMKNLAAQMGLAFENNGVSVQLAKTYLPGSALTQARALATQAGISMTIDNGILAIYVLNKGRNSLPSPPLISADTGMIGYPAYSKTGLFVKTLFNPSIAMGGVVQVKSNSGLTNVNGKWTVISIEHDLDARMPNGHWQSSLQVAPIDGTPIIT